jgi:riboflavin synthase
MFNGIIYNTGAVKKITKFKKSLEITLKTSLPITKKDIGSSICCNGACLTVTNINRGLVSFYLSNETLKKTNFKYIKEGDVINIEKSLNYGSKISGHYVQGHVDTTGKISRILILDNTWIVTFIIKKIFHRYLIEKGSIAINGVSLTLSKSQQNQFQINIIPHTLKLTNLIKLKNKNIVNIEFDIFSKYLINLKN